MFLSFLRRVFAGTFFFYCCSLLFGGNCFFERALRPLYMDNRPASEYAQPGSHFSYPPSVAPSSELSAVDQTSAAAAPYTPQPEVRSAQYTPQPEVRPAANTANISSSHTPQSDYGLNQPPSAAATRSPYPDYLARPPQYHHAPNTQPGSAAGMAQAASPSLTNTLSSGDDGHSSDHHSQSNFNVLNSTTTYNLKSDPGVPIDPSIAASSPTYPPPYSPYQPQGHDMTQYQGHPPPPQMYARPEWAHGYAQHGHHGMPGPYTTPTTTVGSAFPAPIAGPRPGQVCIRRRKKKKNKEKRKKETGFLVEICCVIFSFVGLFATPPEARPGG